MREIALSAWMLAMLSFSWMYSDISVPNERTRVYLTAALVDDHAIHVDRSLERFGSVYDLASHDGHFYTDKAPGSGLLAAPIYALARLRSPADAWTAERLINLIRTWLMIPAGVLGFLLMRRLLRRLGRDEATVGLLSVAYTLGCAVFHYATAFYGHVLVAVLLLGSLCCMASSGVLGARVVPSSRLVRCAWLALAGLCAGLAGLTEYQATLVAVILVLPVAASTRDRLWGSLAYVAGGLPAALVLLAYNKAAFGGALQLSYHHLVGEALNELHNSGVAGATVPTLDAVRGLLLSPHRGLFITAPWLVFGALGLCVGMPGAPRALWLALLLSVGYLFLAVASSSVWHGSWGFGPRLLIPAMPLLAIAAAYTLDRLRGLWPADVLARGSVVFAIAYQLLVQVTFSEPPPETVWPLQQSVVAVLRAGAVAPNLMCKLRPLGQGNLTPLALSMLGLTAYLVVPREGAWPMRIIRALGSLATACVMMLGLWRIAPPEDPAQQAGWGGWVHEVMLRETSCAAPPPTPAPPAAAPAPEPAPPSSDQ